MHIDSRTLLQKKDRRWAVFFRSQTITGIEPIYKQMSGGHLPQLY